VVVKISGGCSQALSLGNSDAVQVGDSVYAVGNPQGLEGTFSQGIVSSIRELGSNKLLQITAPISPGSSGGPVLNEKGEVGRGAK
jgi:S1-C subfamily serine protease